MIATVIAIVIAIEIAFCKKKVRSSTGQNQWRMLRVANSTHNISFIEWDPAFEFSNVSFAALFDVTADPHQLDNQWPRIGAAEQRLWHGELEREFRCKGRSGALACS